MARTKECVNRTELIIAAAQQLFSRYGFERTTIDDIARHAGIGKGSVYLEFQNKEEILLGVIRCFAQRKQAMMTEHLECAKGPYLEELSAMLLAAVMSSYDIATAHLHTPEVLVHTSRNVKKNFRDHFVFIHNIITQFLEKALANGELNDSESPSRYAELTMLSLTGLMPPYLQFGIPGDEEIPPRARVEQNAKDILNVLISGLKKRSS